MKSKLIVCRILQDPFGDQIDSLTNPLKINGQIYSILGQIFQNSFDNQSNSSSKLLGVNEKQLNSLPGP